MSATATAVRVEGLVVARAGRVLLDLPHLHIAVGERVALVGANGAGKSTLLKVLGGFVAPSAGRVQVLGREFGAGAGLSRAGWRALRAEVGQVMQGLHLVPRLSARENVVIGALARRAELPAWRAWTRCHPPALIAQADDALAELGIGALAETRADRLSGGERQKVGLARLRLQRPRLVLADEPTAALDPSATLQACAALLRVAAGGTLVSVLHDAFLLPRLADRVLGLAQGRIVWDRPVAEVGADPLARLYGDRALPGREAAATPPPLRVAGAAR